MRLFVALDIDAIVRGRLEGVVEGLSPSAPDARWIKPESLHVTLKFIGEQPEAKLAAIKKSLAAISAATTDIHFRGFGFFPTAKSARVFWIGMDAGPQLAALAAAVEDQLAALGIEKENRPFSPHITLARAARQGSKQGSGSPRQQKGDRPNRVFERLQEKLSQLRKSDFGTMTPREFFLYQSQLSPKGSKYTKLAGFPLR